MATKTKKPIRWKANWTSALSGNTYYIEFRMQVYTYAEFLGLFTYRPEPSFHPPATEVLHAFATMLVPKRSSQVKRKEWIANNRALSSAFDKDVFSQGRPNPNWSYGKLISWPMKDGTMRDMVAVAAGDAGESGTGYGLVLMEPHIFPHGYGPGWGPTTTADYNAWASQTFNRDRG